ncbi:MAG: histidine kinase [Bacteroidota bacterium]
MSLLLLLAFPGLAQIKSSKLGRQTEPDPAKLLDQATSVQSVSQIKSTDLIDQAVQIAKKQEKPDVLARAYLLLADINEDIQQYELAIIRRKNGMMLFQSMGEKVKMAEQQYEIGRLYNLLKNTDIARLYFNMCLQNEAANSSLLLRCREGLADADRLDRELNKSLLEYSQLESDYARQQDTRSLSRIQAKKANVYAQQQNAPLAEANFRNSTRNLIASQEKDSSSIENDYKDIEEAKESLILNASSDKEIEYRQEHLQLQNSLNIEPNQIVEEQLKIADAYLDKGDLNNASKYVRQSKALIDKVDDSEKVGEIYLRSSEINSQKGDYIAAVQDLKTYESSLKNTNKSKQDEVNELLAILKTQRKIDLFEKDFDYTIARNQYTRTQLFTQRVIIGLLSLLLLGALVSIYFIYKNIREKRKANHMLLLKSLRTQMNPHFIFNVLNSVNNFIARNDERSANKYLSDFSVLMRRVLDDSKLEFISLEKELELISLYLKLEHTRFRDKFDYDIEQPEEIDYNNLKIPPMLIQPFLENAVWHGIRYKEGKGHIQLRIEELEDKLKIVIEDNGIGRKRSMALKTSNQKQYQSTALNNIGQRLKLIRELYSKDYILHTSDLQPEAYDTGTRVEITIPIA